MSADFWMGVVFTVLVEATCTVVFAIIRNVLEREAEKDAEGRQSADESRR